MQSRLVASAALCACLVAPGDLRAEEKDPCRKVWQGQHLADELYKLLAHLKGCEDPEALA